MVIIITFSTNYNIFTFESVKNRTERTKFVTCEVNISIIKKSNSYMFGLTCLLLCSCGLIKLCDHISVGDAAIS